MDAGQSPFPASPSCVQAPSRLMMFLCLPIIFIISISEMRSDRSFSVASAKAEKAEVGDGGWMWVPPYRSIVPGPPLPHHHLHLSIFTATLVTRFGLSLSSPMASASTTCPKHPSPSGLPRMSLAGGDIPTWAHGASSTRLLRQRIPRHGWDLTYPAAAPSAGPRGARTRRRRPAWGCRWRRGARAGPASPPSSWRSWSRPRPAVGAWVTFTLHPLPPCQGMLSQGPHTPNPACSPLPAGAAATLGPG